MRALHRGGRATQSELQATIKAVVEAQAELEEATDGE